MILDGVEQKDHGVLVASRILLSVEAPLQTPVGVSVPRASIGVADWRDQQTPDAFLHDADVAMYAAKSMNQDGDVTVLEVTPEHIDA